MTRSTKYDSGTTPTQAVAGLNRTLTGFTDTLEPQLGVSITSKTQNLISSIGTSGPASTLSSINNTLEQVLGAQSLEDLSIDYQGPLTLKVGIPEGIKNTVSGISSTLESLISSLETAKIILEALRALVVSLEDALKILLEEVLSRITSIINIFKVDAKVRVLAIPPIVPSPNTNTAAPNAIDTAIVNSFAQVVDKAFVTAGGEERNLPGFLTRDSLRDQLVGFSRSGRNMQGSATFLDTFSKSFSDEEDFNRPTEALGWSAGLLVKAGFPAVQDLLNTWEQIQKLLISGYVSFFDDAPQLSPSKPAISRVKVVGYDASSGSAEIFVDLNNPSGTIESTNLYPSLVKYAGEMYELYVVQDPSTVADPTKKALLFQSFDKYRDNNFEGLTSVVGGSLPNFGPVSALDLTNNPRQRTFTVDSTGEPLLQGSTYSLKLKVVYNTYELKDGEYTLVTSPLQEIIRFSAPVSIRIPVNPNLSARPLISSGTPPNWLKYGKDWTFPVFDDLKVYFNKLIEYLRSFLSTASNAIQQIINLYIKLIDKLRGLLQVLLNVNYLIEKLLNLELGASIVTFTANGGAAGIKKAVEDYLNAQKEGYETAVANEADTSDYAWFANGESVCGAVLVATSETAEIVERLFSAFSLLFSSESEANPSDQLSVDASLSNTANISTGAISSGSSFSMFSDALGGLDASEHLQSPENTCG